MVVHYASCIIPGARVMGCAVNWAEARGRCPPRPIQACQLGAANPGGSGGTLARNTPIAYFKTTFQLVSWMAAFSSRKSLEVLSSCFCTAAGSMVFTQRISFDP